MKKFDAIVTMEGKAIAHKKFNAHDKDEANEIGKEFFKAHKINAPDIKKYVEENDIKLKYEINEVKFSSTKESQ